MRKGFSLLEVLIASSVAAIIIALVLPITFEFFQYFKMAVNYNREDFYTNEALMFIQRKLTSNNVKSITIDGNKLIVYKTDSSFVDKIYFVGASSESGNIVLEYKNQENTITVNNIVKNIKEFNIQKINKVIYIDITTIYGKKYEKCIGSDSVS